MTKKTRIQKKIESGQLKKMDMKPNFISATGRRKTAICSVFLYESKGEILVNGMDINEYFSDVKSSESWMIPFHAVGVSHPDKQYSATLKVKGSGKPSQLGAVIHAFSRALVKSNEEFRPILSKQGLLTRDSRMVERKKPFLRKARKAPQYSKR